MEGGGDKGAYEAGVLYGFVKNAKNPEDFQYDVLTGISVGSINAMGLAQFEKGQEEAAVQFLVDGWRNTKQKDVFKSWAGGLLEGLFYKSALFNSDPEIDYLNERIFTIPNKRRITVATTDFVTGQKVTFSESDWANDRTMAVNAALYSSAVPVVFKYRNVGNQTFIDGGWSGEGMDVEDAIFRCREIVDSDDQIVLDILFANNRSFTDASSNKFNAFQMHSRHQAIKSYASQTRAYFYARTAFPDIKFRYVMIASEKLPDQTLPLDFKAKNIEFMIQLGIKDAIAALAEGEGVSAERALNIATTYQDDLFFNRQDNDQ
jgi:predicted acylesterase/phospholipase RssA